MLIRLGLLDDEFYVLYGISFIMVGISMLYRNKKNDEKFKKVTLSMIYNSKKYRRKFRNANLLASFLILMGILFVISGIISINITQAYSS